MSFKVDKSASYKLASGKMASSSAILTQSLLTQSFFKRALIVAVVAGLTSVPAMAEIYKITKADGSVVYSDRPDQNKQSKVEVMQIPSSNKVNSNSSNNSSYTGSNNTGSNNIGSNSSSQSSNTQSNNVNYSIKITSPSEERAYRKPVQNVEVAVTVSPQLRAGDRVVILVDGVEVASGTSASIPTTSLNPGEHTLEVKIDSENSANASAASMKFYVIQNTLAMQQKRKLAEQVIAYDALPWYKKIIAKIKPTK